MQAVSADRAGEADIAGDQEQDTPRAADRSIARRDAGAPWVVIIAIDDGGASGQRSEDRLGIFDPAPVGQKGERKWRGGRSAASFECGGGGC